jgi:hypothetical protein
VEQIIVLLSMVVFSNSEINGSAGNYLLKKFSDIFVTDSLSSLPPYRVGFD